MPHTSLPTPCSKDYGRYLPPPPHIAMVCVLQLKSFTESIEFKGDLLEWEIMVTPKVIPELLHVQVIPIIWYGDNGKTTTSLDGQFHILITLTCCGCLQGIQLPILPPPPPPYLTTLPNLSGVWSEIQWLSIEQGFSENLTEFLWHIKVGGCSLGGIWYPNDCLIYTPVAALSEIILHFIIIDPQ